jgi:uncharacterized protein (DUF433 family)
VTEEVQLLAQKLDDIAKRVERLEDLASQGARWQYLVARPHSWRRQLGIKGRNMTVGQLVSTVRANCYTPEQASENLGLPLAAIHEALAYYAENRSLIELEASEERRRLAQEGYPLEPKDLPR